MISPTGAEQVQKIEHAQRMLKMRLDQIHAEQQRLLAEQNTLWLEMTALDNELATLINAHLADA